MIKYLKSLFKLKKVKTNRPEGKCTTCHFNCGENCDAGTFYAEQGKTGLCIQGELWKLKEV